jgi:hypothetical protein
MESITNVTVTSANIIFSNGRAYKGQVKVNDDFSLTPHGEGTLYFDEEMQHLCYNGEFADGVMEGQGEMFYHPSEIKIKGTLGDFWPIKQVGFFKAGSLIGRGSLHMPTPGGLGIHCVYDGELVDGVPHGQGQRIWYEKNGDKNKFEGAFVSGHPTWGKFMASNGSVFIGQLKRRADAVYSDDDQVSYHDSHKNYDMVEGFMTHERVSHKFVEHFVGQKAEAFYIKSDNTFVPDLLHVVGAQTQKSPSIDTINDSVTLLHARVENIREDLYRRVECLEHCIIQFGSSLQPDKSDSNTDISVDDEELKVSDLVGEMESEQGKYEHNCAAKLGGEYGSEDEF